MEGASTVMVVIHDAFQSILNWEYFFTTEGLGSTWDNFGLDTHIYQVWGDAPTYSWEQHLNQPCTRTSELSQSNSNWTTVSVTSQFPGRSDRDLTPGLTSFGCSKFGECRSRDSEDCALGD